MYTLKFDVPFGAIETAVVGAERQLGIAFFLAAREDISAVGGSKTVFFVIVFAAENVDLLFFLALQEGVARGTVIEGQTDGVEQRGLAAAGGAYDAEDRGIAESAFFKVDHFAFGVVKGGEIEYFEFN